jgi:aminomethyltransferase
MKTEEPQTLKKTPLYETHVSLGAKMVPFAGYLMPVSYSGLNDEHQAVRNSVGVFDVSHMGEFIIRGKGATELIQWVTSNDVSTLVPGKAQYSCLPNDKGGIVDDLIVYCLGTEEFLLVVNASNIEKDFNWISSQNKWGAEMIDISEKTALLAVQGPNAGKVLASLTETDLNAIPYYHFSRGNFAGVENVIISNTGYTGAGGFELYFSAEHAPQIWKKIFDAGAAYGIKPAGLGARDTLRLEMGFCLYGNEIDDTTSPLEAGLGWITKLKTGFLGSDLLLKQKEAGLKNNLVGFEMIERAIPRTGYEVKDGTGMVIGLVTSGTQSPSLQKGIGLAYVSPEFASPGSEIFVVIREKPVAAKVCYLPFIKKA